MPAGRSSTPEPLGLAAALLPVVALVGLLGLSFFLFGDAAASGPNQVALVFCSIVAIAVAWRHGHSIDDLRDAAVASVTAGVVHYFAKQQQDLLITRHEAAADSLLVEHRHDERDELTKECHEFILADGGLHD